MAWSAAISARCAACVAGHYQRVSPVDAIADMVAPVVLTQFAAIVLATKVMTRSVDTLAYETRHTSDLR